MDLTDQTLMNQLLSHRDWIRRLAERLVADPHRAADVAQETWLRTLRQPPRHGSHLRAWLGRVVRSVIRDEARAGDRRKAREEAVPLPAAEEERPERIAQRIQLEQDLVRAVMELPRAQRDVVLLRFYGGRTIGETAERLGIAPGTVESRQHRAVKRLRDRLTRDHDERTWVALLGFGLPPGRPGKVLALEGAAGTGSIASAAWASGVVLAIAAWGGAWWWSRLPSSPTERAGAASAVAASRASDPPGEGIADAPEPIRSPEPVAASGAPPSAPSEEEEVSLGEGGLRIVAAGRPAAARVVLFSDRLLLGPVATDDDGIARFRPTEVDVDPAEEVWALVLPAVGLPELHPISPGGTREIELTVGERSVRGRVVVDGAVPDRPVPLFWIGDARLAWMEALPTDVRLRAKLPFRSPARQISLLTDERGAFELSGLAEGVTGELAVDERFHIEGTSRGDARGRAVAIDPPLADLVVRLQALPALRGAVVDGSTGRPLPDLSGSCHVMFRDGGQSPLTTFHCDSEGRFSVPIGMARSDLDWSNPNLRPAFEEVRVWIRRGSVEREFAFAGSALPPSGDVGALAMASGETVPFRVLDPAGAPIAGAHVWTGNVRGAGSLSDPTDGSGAGAVAHVADGTAILTAGAPGRGTASATVALPATEVVVLTLAPANALEVRVTPPPLGPTRLLLRVESDGALLDDDPAAFRLRRELGWKGVFLARFGVRHSTLLFRVPPSGVVRLEDLRPGRPFTVAVEDAVAGPLRAVDVPGLSERERRTLDLEVDRERTWIDGEVVGPSNAPVGGAEVTFATEHGTMRTTAGVDGRFSLGPLLLARGERGELRARGGGATSGRVSVELSPAFPVRLRLAPHRILEVDVTDVEGTPVDVRGATLSLDHDGAPVRGERVGPARFRFRGLSAGETGSIEVTVGGRTVRRSCSTSDGRATVVVPVHGAIEVRVGAAAADARYVDATVRVAPRGDIDRWPLGYGEGARRVGASAYLPGTYEVSVSMPYTEPPRLLRARTVEVRAGETSVIEFP